MPTVLRKSRPLRLAGVAFEGDILHARFADGTTIAVNVKRFPRLRSATPPQRKKWRLIDKRLGVHWVEIDEDLSMENFLFASAKDSV